jgi:AraC-like DNA-binding protein
VRPAAGTHAFLQAPVGSYVVGTGWLYWSANEYLFGFILWGSPNGDAIRKLVTLLAVELGSPVVPHVSLVDARRLERVDEESFRALNDYVAARRRELAGQVQRLAIVLPKGMEGATVAGFFRVLEPPYPVEVFPDAERALAWLDRTADAPVLAELDRLVAEATATAPDVAPLRALVEAEPATMTLRRAARSLGVSVRTLQRRLRDANTSFQDELARARLKAAEKRLLDSNAQLTAIAIDVGYASLQHFSAMFHRLKGESPSSWRARHRRS